MDHAGKMCFTEQMEFDERGNLTGANTTVGMITKAIQGIRQVAASTAATMRRTHRLETMKQINMRTTQGCKSMYRYLRRDMGTPTCVVQHPVTKKHIFKTEDQHSVMIEAWKTVFGKHKGTESQWAQFIDEYGKFEPGLHDAPHECPTAQMMHSRAQKSNDESSAESDGFAPKETKALSLAA